MQSPSIETMDLLTQTGLVSGMSLEQIQVLAELGHLEEIADGESLVTFGESDFDLIQLVEGRCEIRTSMNDVLSSLGAGSLIGELSFIDHKPRSAKAIAVGACRTIRFPASLLDDLEVRRPDIAAKLLKNIGLVLCQKLRSTTRFAEATFV